MCCSFAYVIEVSPVNSAAVTASVQTRSFTRRRLRCIHPSYQWRRRTSPSPAARGGRAVNQATYTRCVRPVAAAMARVHIAVHQATGGRVGQRWRGGQVAILSTVGRKTRRRRSTPLVCLQDGSNIVVVASNGGS